MVYLAERAVLRGPCRAGPRKDGRHRKDRRPYNPPSREGLEEVRGHVPVLRKNCAGDTPASVGETLLPPGDPFLPLCGDCAKTTGGDLETNTTVMAAIAGGMENLEGGMAAFLQFQIDLVERVLQEIREKDMEKESDAQLN